MEGREPTTTFFHIQCPNDEQRDIVVQINTHEAIHEHESNICINTNNSAQTQRPSTNLIENEEERARHKYLTLGVKLYKATLRGDWKTAEQVLNEDPSLLRTSITRRGQTILHLAAGTKHTHFMEKLLKKLKKEDLELPDDNNNTPFCYAVWGEKAVANIMLKENESLATIHGGKDMTPLYMAAVFGRSQMAKLLFDKTRQSLGRVDKICIFFACINSDLYGIALDILKLDETIATERDGNNNTVLHVLAQKPSAFDNKTPEGWSKLFKSAYFKCGFNRNMKQSTTLELVERLWKHILFLGHKKTMNLIKYPSHLLFEATKLGNFEFVAALLKSYPDLIYETDSHNRSILHYAIMYRHANIYNLVGEFGSIKDLLATFEDTEGNNVLHLVALLPPADRLGIVSGAALQMQQELLWFDVVKKNVQPLFVKATNKNGVEPQQLFTSQHKNLLRCGESWMKSTANSCMIVATLIATVVFAAAFTLPGGNNDKDGTPHELQSYKFLIFVLSDAFALLNSVISISMFLAILVSRYTEHDFLKQLPLKLMVGLTSLFLSLIAMMLAFSFSFMIAYDHHGLKWVPLLISMLAVIPIALFALLKFPLLIDTFRSTYNSSTVFQPTQLVLC